MVDKKDYGRWGNTCIKVISKPNTEPEKEVKKEDKKDNKKKK
jgi:hypothetical protein